MAGIDSSPDDESKLYCDLVTSLLTDTALRALKEAMKMGGYEYQSDFARKYVAEGKAEGKADEARRLVLRLLARQVGLLGPELQARVEELDVDRLEELAEELLGFKALGDLQAWLDKSA